VFIHPRRSVLVRTRLDPAAIEERLSAWLGEKPDHWRQLVAHGYVTDGTTTPDGFVLDYTFNAPRNRQTYIVRGTVSDTGDWRHLSLDLEAREPWFHPWALTFALVLLAFPVYGGTVSVLGALAMLAFLLGVYGVANLLYVPDVSARRVADLVADRVNGSVQVKGGWQVPK
jgi:hypothetical protein